MAESKIWSVGMDLSDWDEMLGEKEFTRSFIQ